MSSIAIYESFKHFYKIHIESHPQNESITDIMDVETGIVQTLDGKTLKALME